MSEKYTPSPEQAQENEPKESALSDRLRSHLEGPPDEDQKAYYEAVVNPAQAFLSGDRKNFDAVCIEAKEDPLAVAELLDQAKEIDEEFYNLLRKNLLGSK